MTTGVIVIRTCILVGVHQLEGAGGRVQGAH